jgi:hypothetical protein
MTIDKSNLADELADRDTEIAYDKDVIDKGLEELLAKLEAAEENILKTHIDWQNKIKTIKAIGDYVNDMGHELTCDQMHGLDCNCSKGHIEGLINRSNEGDG